MNTEAFVIGLFFTTKQKTHSKKYIFKFLCLPALERKQCHDCKHGIAPLLQKVTVQTMKFLTSEQRNIACTKEPFSVFLDGSQASVMGMSTLLDKEL